MFIYIFFVIIVSVNAGNKIENVLSRLPYDYELYENVLDPELCEQQLGEMNMFEFFDASFRIPQNLLKGNFYSLGNYHQCLAINQPQDESSIRGKYCVIQTDSLQVPVLDSEGQVAWAHVDNVWNEQNLRIYAEAQRKLAAFDEDSSRASIVDAIGGVPPLTLAVCVPQSCSVADFLDPLVNSSDGQFSYVEEFCRLPDDKPWAGADIAAIVIFSLIGCLTLASTAYELNHIFFKKATTKPDELMSSFSVYGNTDRFLSFGSKAGTLDCLDGIRAMSILWVIAAHSFLVHFGTYVSNLLDVAELLGSLKSAYLVAGTFSVDSFLLLSGLLLVYTSANKMKQMKLIKSLHLFYLLRLLRMFPLLAAAVLLQASIFHHVSDGVRWDVVAEETQICRDYWWSALLHVQNIVNPRTICLPQTWYLSVDFQLHLLSPLLLFWVLGSRRSAWTGLAAAILGSLTFVTIFTFFMNFPGAQGLNYNIYFYNNTLARTPVFIIGMACGYLLHVTRTKKILMPWWFVCLGHSLAASLSLYCVYQVHPDWNQLVTNLNIALTRPAWAISLSWLIVACVNGYAGPINWFLSLKLWKFVARISYALYIFHFPVQFATVGANIMPIYYTFEYVFICLASDLVYTGILATVACVLIDAPFATLVRRLMAVIAPPPPKKENKEGIRDAKVPDVVEVKSEYKSNGYNNERL